ncbi:uncharacterized protein [Montipora foliosa]|uniref:uncharacterized protein n=1 Tax=Montipora foliosa TaxID=591990 RepID=UPI0035F203E3
MASLLKAVYLLIALSIASDFVNLRGYWFNNVEDITVHSSSLILPGANGWIGPAAKAVEKAVSRSAKKAAKKKEKNQRRVQGNDRNKARKSQGGAEHTKNARPSTKNKHQKAQARRNREQSNSKKG